MSDTPCLNAGIECEIVVEVCYALFASCFAAASSLVTVFPQMQ